MDKFEKYVAENRNLFDDSEPPEGHFDRFRDKLEGQPVARIEMSRSLLLKIAAGLLILLTVSVFIFDFAMNRIRNNFQNNASAKELPADLQEAVNYYDGVAASHLNKIRKLACCGQDSRSLYSMASGELDALDANARELKKACENNPGDERVQSALIRNQQMKETVMNNMIRQMKSAKK